MLSYTVSVYDINLQFSSNSESFLREIRKDLNRFAVSDSSKAANAEWSFSVSETTSTLPLQIPEFAIRDSIMFPSAQIYVLNNLIYLEDKEKYIIKIDNQKKTVEAYVKPSVSIIEKIRFLIKRVLIKTLESRNIYFIHGAAIERNDLSIVFAGSFSMACLKN